MELDNSGLTLYFIQNTGSTRMCYISNLQTVRPSVESARWRWDQHIGHLAGGGVGGQQAKSSQIVKIGLDSNHNKSFFCMCILPLFPHKLPQSM